MAIDTAAKRSSALDHEEPWQFGIPFPDGAVSQADRQHLAHTYSGILVSAVVVVTHGARRGLETQNRGAHDALPRITGGAGARGTHKADD